MKFWAICETSLTVLNNIEHFMKFLKISWKVSSRSVLSWNILNVSKNSVWLSCCLVSCLFDSHFFCICLFSCLPGALIVWLSVLNIFIVQTNNVFVHTVKIHIVNILIVYIYIVYIHIVYIYIKQSMSATIVERVSSPNRFAELQITGIEPATQQTLPLSYALKP